MVFGWIVIVSGIVALIALMTHMLSWDSRPGEVKLDRWAKLAIEVELDAYESAERRKEMEYRTIYYTV